MRRSALLPDDGAPQARTRDDQPSSADPLEAFGARTKPSRDPRIRHFESAAAASGEPLVVPRDPDDVRVQSRDTRRATPPKPRGEGEL